MKIRTWEITLDSTKHVVKVFHHRWWGKFDLTVNNNLIIKNKRIGFGQTQLFLLGEQQCEFAIVPGSRTYHYLVFINGETYPSVEEPIFARASNAIIEDRSRWYKIASHLKLKYAPSTINNSFAWRHRLIGTINGFPIVIQLGNTTQNTYRIAIRLLISYSPVFDEENFKQQIINDPVIEIIFGKANNKLPAENRFNKNYAWLALPFDWKKYPPEIIIEQVHKVVGQIAKYVHPPVLDMCEGINCQKKYGESLKFVLVNGNLLVLCDNCIIDIPNWGQQSEKSYKKIPSSLLKGSLIGLSIAFLGSLVWALTIILFNRLGAIFAAGIFITIMKMMDKVRTKRTFFSWTIAIFLTVSSVFSGVYISTCWFTIREVLNTISVSTLPFMLKIAWDIMWKDTRLLNLSFSLALFGIVPYAILM